MKKCTICKLFLEEKEFCKDKSRHDGLNARCKSCNAIKQKKYAEKNREKIRQINNKSAKKRKDNGIKLTEEQKRKQKEYAILNKEKIRKYQQKWQEKNKQKRNEQAKLRERNKKKIDPQYKLNRVISTSIYQSLKIFNLDKSDCGWEKAVGYKLKDLVEHLENQFDENMNWNNYGSYWHIDHIKPKSSFVFESIESEQFKECWSLNNLRPLEAKENIRKSNKILS